MERDDEVKGQGNSLDFGARIYDPRVGRWLSSDPSASKQPSFSPYKAFLNNPLVYIDPDGRTEYETIIINDADGNFLAKAFREVSSNVMSGGLVKLDDGGGGYTDASVGYDYRTVTVMQLQDDGSIKVMSKDVEMLKQNGPKDYEYFGFKKKKGTIYNCNIFKDPNGMKMEGGVNYVTKDGGSSPSEFTSKTNVETKDISDLMDAVGALPLGKLSGFGADRFKDLFSIIEKAIEVKDRLEKVHDPVEISPRPILGVDADSVGSVSQRTDTKDSIFIDYEHTYYRKNGDVDVFKSSDRKAK
jgi:RHS repeat-associated protein